MFSVWLEEEGEKKCRKKSVGERLKEEKLKKSKIFGVFKIKGKSKFNIIIFVVGKKRKCNILFDNLDVEVMFV